MGTGDTFEGHAAVTGITFLIVEGASHIKGISYMDDGTLTVKFADSSYRYKDVPIEVYEKLRDANEDPDRSLGKEFRALVVKGGYEYTKL